MSTPQTVPFIDLERAWSDVREDALATAARVLDSQRYIGGEEVAGFERELSEWVGVRHAVGSSSGTDAQLAMMMALGLREGDEVITSPFTFFATAGGIARTGAKPVFVDIHPRTFNLDPDAVAAAIGPNTIGIVPVHLFGQMANMRALSGLADRHGLWVVEDAAQAVGATFAGRPPGAWGVGASLSFFPTKNLGAAGDGGAVLTDDDALADRVRLLSKHGARPKYHHVRVGANFRLDALQAAILRVKLARLSDWHAQRAESAAHYDALLADVSGVTTPYVHPDATHVWHQYTVRVERRDEVQARLKELGVGSMVYYPEPLHLQPCFEHLLYFEGNLPNAERAAREVLSLPIFPGITPGERERVASALAEAVRGSD